LGVAAVYSKVTPYKEIIRDGENGLLTENTAKSWESALRRLLENPTLRASLRNQARREVQEHYSQEAVCKKWKALFKTANLQPAQPRAPEQIPLITRFDRRGLRRLYNFYDLYGWATPYRAFLWLLWKLGLRKSAN